MVLSEEYIVSCSAPTICGIKTGSLFTCPCESPSELYPELREFNRAFASKGLRLLLLRVSGGRALVYLYRPSRLRRDLARPEAAELMRSAGYEGLSESRGLGELIRRLRAGGDFPHEIGLFLSYPPEDVRGFIENRGKNSKAVGHWKVYGDEKKAQKTFSAYRKCTESCLKKIAMGVPMARLAASD